MEKVWRFAIEEKLGVRAQDCPAVVLLDSLQQGPRDREISAEVMFETLGVSLDLASLLWLPIGCKSGCLADSGRICCPQVGGLHCELQQAAALYESGKDTAMVLDVGYGGSRVFAQHAGLPMPCGGVLSLGGQDVDDSIATAMSQLGLHSLVARTAARYDLLTQLKADCCRVSQSKKFGCAAQPYTMMNGLTVMLEAPIQFAPQLLFDPSLAGLKQRSVVDLLLDAANQVEDNLIRQTLLQNIVVTGGVATTHGFCERLAAELQSRIKGVQVGVSAAGGAHQIAVPWIGGSMVGASPAAVCVSKAGYEEYGMRIVQEAYDWTAAEIATSNCRSRRADDKAPESPGPDNREDLREIFEDSPRAPRPTDHQLLARVDTIIAQPRNPEQRTLTKVETAAVQNAHKYNVTARGHEDLGPKSGTLGAAGIRHAYEMEERIKAMQLNPPSLGEAPPSRPAIPRLPVDHTLSPLVAEERAMLGAERLFSPSATCITPRGTAAVVNSGQTSSGMPLARYMAAEVDRAGAPRGPRPPLDPRLYREEEASIQGPSLPMSKLWTQGPAPPMQAVASHGDSMPGAPTPSLHTSFEQRRISKMHNRVAMLSPATHAASEAMRSTRPLHEELPNEMVPRSPIFNMRVQAERSRMQSVVQSGVEMDRVLARTQAVPVDFAHGPVEPRQAAASSVVSAARYQRDVFAAPEPEPEADEPDYFDVHHAVQHDLSHKRVDGRLYDTVANRTVRAERSLSPQHTRAPSSDHARFMAKRMENLERAIEPIGEDEYEVYMAIENKKVLRLLEPDETHPYLGACGGEKGDEEEKTARAAARQHMRKAAAEGKMVEHRAELKHQEAHQALLDAQQAKRQDTGAATEFESIGLSKKEALKVGQANNYEAQHPVALSFENNDFKRSQRRAAQEPSTDQSSTGYKETFTVVDRSGRAGGLSKKEAIKVGQANNYDAKAPVALSFENNDFKRAQRPDPVPSPAAAAPVAPAVSSDQQAKEEAYRVELEAKRAARRAQQAQQQAGPPVSGEAALKSYQDGQGVTAQKEAAAAAARRDANAAAAQLADAEVAAEKAAASRRARKDAESSAAAQASRETEASVAAKAAREEEWRRADVEMAREKAERENSMQAAAAERAAAAKKERESASQASSRPAAPRASSTERTRELVRNKRRSSISEEEKAVKREQQNRELEEEKRRRAQAQAPAQKAKEPSGFRAMKDLGDSDEDDFNEMMAAMPKF